MQITIHEPVYLTSYYDNIETKATWNASVSEAMKQMADQIAGQKTDVLEVEIKKNDELAEFVEASGFIGYAGVSSASTDYYYVDLSISASDDPLGDKKHLLNSLGEILDKHKDWSLSKCQFEDDTDRAVLRAYFVKELVVNPW